MILRGRSIAKNMDMIHPGDAEAQIPEPGVRSDDAIFLGWQRMKSGEIFALYNVIVKGHPSFGSTVTDDGLRRLSLRIPEAPPPDGPVRKF